MKKIFTLFAMVVFCHLAFGQATRLVLVEEFTQASCPPCASQNPGFNTLLSANTDKATSIKYQVWWPGYDPMYNQNEPDVDARVAYYGVSGVPHGIVDGVFITNDCGYYTGAPACLNQTEIDNAAAVTSPIELILSHSLSSDLSTINVSLTINGVGSVTGNFVAHVAVVEKEINFETPPGSNGELDFYNVMKKMLPSSTGTTLPGTIDVGYTNTIDLSWTMANIYNLNQVAIVAWVQDNTNKSVLQAAYSVPLPPPTTYAFVNTVTSPAITCIGSIVPSVTIKNDGATDLTSSVISYSVDNGTPSTYSWTGTLAAGAVSSAISLPATTISNGGHNFSAWVSNVNGSDISPGIINPVTIANGIGTPGLTPILEGFVGTTFPPANWIVANPDLGETWKRSTLAGGFGLSTNSAKYPFYVVAEGAVDELYAPNFDFTDATYQDAYLEFSLAKAKYTGYNDQLKIVGSKDCGATWTTLYDKEDLSGLSTATATNDWKPSSSQWREEVIDLSDMIGSSNVIIKFVAISGYGNNLYIDDINIHYGFPTGIEESNSITGISIFPNPSNEMTTIQINGIVPAGSKLEFMNMLGQRIYSTTAKSGAMEVTTSTWPAGLYMLRIVDSGTILHQDKVNVSH